MNRNFKFRIGVFFLGLAFLAFTITFCRKAEEKELWILCDWDTTYPLLTPYGSSEGKDFSKYVHYLTGLESEQVEFEFLPVKDAERSTRLTALRTEIMSGGGPDVFLLSCWLPGIDNADVGGFRDYYRNHEPLFPDVRAAMENGVFLPLDSYLENSLWLDISLCNSVAVEAGRTQKGQMVLPITYTFPVSVFRQDSCDSEIVNERSRAIAARQQFSDVFGELADYSDERLLFSKDELLESVQHYLRLSSENQNSALEGVASVFYLTAADASSWDWDYHSDKLSFGEFPGISAQDSQAIAAVPNMENGVTAAIVAYACINRSTRYPEEAFRTVDLVFHDDIQSAIHKDSAAVRFPGFHVPETGMQTFLLTGCGGCPVRNDLMKDQIHSFQQQWFYDSDDGVLFSEYTALRNEVTHARFYGALDQELQTMYEACLEAKTDEEIEKIVSKAYDTMLMILAES